METGKSMGQMMLENLKDKHEIEKKNVMQADMEASINSAKSYAMRKNFTDMYVALYREKLFNGEFNNVVPEEDLERYKEILEEKEEKKQSGKRKGKGVLITINPPDDLEFDEFKGIIEGCMKWKWIESYIYTYETRGYDNDKAKGVHCHIFLNRGDYTPGHLERDFRKRFQNLMEVKNPHIMNFRYFSDEDIPNGMNYVKGIKKGTTKKNYLSDKKFRLENNLGDFYTNNRKLETGKLEN